MMMMMMVMMMMMSLLLLSFNLSQDKRQIEKQTLDNSHETCRGARIPPRSTSCADIHTLHNGGTFLAFPLSLSDLLYAGDTPPPSMHPRPELHMGKHRTDRVSRLHRGKRCGPPQPVHRSELEQNETKAFVLFFASREILYSVSEHSLRSE